MFDLTGATREGAQDRRPGPVPASIDLMGERDGSPALPMSRFVGATVARQVRVASPTSLQLVSHPREAASMGIPPP